MDRRNSIKALVVGTFSTSVILDGCKPADKKADDKHDHGKASANGDGKKWILTTKPLQKKCFLMTMK